MLHGLCGRKDESRKDWDFRNELVGQSAEWLGSAVWPAMAAYAWVAYALAVAVTYSRLYLEMHTIPQVQHPTYRFFA